MNSLAHQLVDGWSIALTFLLQQIPIQFILPYSYCLNWLKHIEFISFKRLVNTEYLNALTNKIQTKLVNLQLLALKAVQFCHYL
jgi:hypothetical protein